MTTIPSLLAGVSVAFANKKPVTGTMEVYKQLALLNPKAFRNESTVCPTAPRPRARESEEGAFRIPRA